MKKIIITCGLLSALAMLVNPLWYAYHKGQVKNLGHNWIWNTGDPYNQFTSYYDDRLRALVFPQVDYRRTLLYVAAILIATMVVIFLLPIVRKSFLIVNKWCRNAWIAWENTAAPPPLPTYPDGTKRMNQQNSKAIEPVISAKELKHESNPVLKTLIVACLLIAAAHIAISAYSTQKDPVTEQPRTAAKIEPAKKPEPITELKGEDPFAGTNQKVVDYSVFTTEWYEEQSAYWQQTIELYPQAKNLQGPFYQRMKQMDKWAQINDPDLYSNPMKPIIYAQSVAEEFGER